MVRSAGKLVDVALMEERIDKLILLGPSTYGTRVGPLELQGDSTAPTKPYTYLFKLFPVVSNLNETSIALIKAHRSCDALVDSIWTSCVVSRG